MAAPSSLLLRESVGAALRFARENWRFAATAGAAGAGALTLVTALTMSAPVLGLPATIAQGFVQSLVYAALTAAALYGAAGAPARVMRDSVVVWGAMAIVVFFLFIVFSVLTIPVLIIMFTGPLAAYAGALEQAGQDQAAVLAVMSQFAQENPGAVLTVLGFYGAICLYLTSRLYLAAPASLSAGRILVFDTWSWTKGAAARIAGARLLLLIPANVLVGALGYLVGRVIGFDTLNMADIAGAAAANPVGVLAYTFVASFASLAFYAALEAGLSVAFFRALRRETAAAEA